MNEWHITSHVIAIHELSAIEVTQNLTKIAENIVLRT